MSEEDRAVFFDLAKTNFSRVFPTADTTAEEALMNLQELMAEDGRMVRYLG